MIILSGCDATDSLWLVARRRGPSRYTLNVTILKNWLRVAVVEFARRGKSYADRFVDMESSAGERSRLRSGVRAEHRISED
jgi:hypothetical protein